MLTSLTLPWQQSSLLAFLRRAEGGARFFWESDQADVSFAGFGIAARVEAAGPRRFDALREEASRLFGGLQTLGDAPPPGVGPRFFGGIAFDPDFAPHGVWAAFPNSLLVLPRYLLTRTAQGTWLTVSARFPAGGDARALAWELREMAWDLPAPAQPPRADGYTAAPRVEDLMAYETWSALVSGATAAMHNGGLQKVVLAHSRRACAAAPPDPVRLLDRLGARYPDCYRFLFEPVPGCAWLGATPELLAETRGRDLRSVALAGSLKRGATLREDETLAVQLLSSDKDRREHALVVEQIRAHLTPLTETIEAAPAPQRLPLNNIQHLHLEFFHLRPLEDCLPCALHTGLYLIRSHELFGIQFHRKGRRT